MRTAVLAAAMSSAPIARPAIALFPAANPNARVDVNTEFEVVPPSEAYEEIIQEASAEYDVDASLIRAVMQAESAFHPYAVSRAGAEGLMQLMPALADEMGVTAGQHEVSQGGVPGRVDSANGIQLLQETDDSVMREIAALARASIERALVALLAAGLAGCFIARRRRA